MQDITIGLKLFIFDKLFLLDICPLFWRFGVNEGEGGFTIGFGPIFIGVIW